jgi:hypothetical protein
MFLVYDLNSCGDQTWLEGKHLQQRFPHFFHAWLVILQCYAFCTWSVGLLLSCKVWGQSVHTTEHPLARYVMANIIAGCLGWVFTVAHFVSILLSKRPYSLPGWKKRPREELEMGSDDGKEKMPRPQRWWPVTWNAEDGNYCTIEESGEGCEYVRRQVLDKAYGEIKKLRELQKDED